MRKLLIIGARGFGREVFNLATHCSGYNKEWIIKGFLDDNQNALKNYNYSVGILSSVEEYKVEDQDIFICALGDVVSKKKYSEIILSKGGVFINLIHPTAIINQNVVLGNGVLVFANCLLSNDIKIGDHVTIQPSCVVGHDAMIGNWCHINCFTFLGGFSEIQDNVTLHTRSTILPKMKVEDGAVVGAGSIVIKRVKTKTTVFGNPAVEVRF